MIKRILVANRGEIAVRVIRACKELGIETIAVYSEADKNAMHVKLADEAYCIGGKLSKDSYLNFVNIFSVATLKNVDAIHPGYGFLAENAEFARMCKHHNVIFIGPSPKMIEEMGNKDVARKMMNEAGIPVVPGSTGVITSERQALEVTEEIGYPVIIKAAAGGGGKGIRIAYSEQELIKGLSITRAEAETAFGNSSIYLEKYIEKFRHIEFQILADHHGHVIHLGERECTIQRRLQKLIEETPSSILSSNMREEMGKASISAAKSIGYQGAGTIEYIYDYENHKYYFMEMNTRIQVEHTVTEMVTNIDLIKEQIKIANGEHLSISQEDVKLTGWAIECRINAENPEIDFRPSAGTVKVYHAPGGLGIRVDSALYTNYMIPPFYDSMIAKLIAYGANREEAIARMIRSLEEFVIEGVQTTIPFHLKILNDKTFRRGEFDNNYLGQHFEVERNVE